ncbi:MAG: 23S rRNA (adenine(2503)-C(2))-methyltransferase RlmN [Bdellovibrionales bacterium]
MLEKIRFYNLNMAELADVLKGLGKEGFRAQQLFRWVYGERQTDPEKMLNLAKDFRKELPARFDFSLPEIVTEHVSKDGTKKYLFNVGAGKTVEAVVIPSEDRLTLCLSSEVGCNMACKFCFTAKQKLQRRLETWEIVGQYLVVNDRLALEGQKLTNIVFMGMGEPLDNPDNVFKSIEIFHSPWGLNLSRKKITVSTSGIVPMIPLVAKSGARLAVSLNAVNDQVRSEVMPINKRWPLKDLLAACQQHYEDSGDKITFEYVLLKGVTDSLADAKALYELTKPIPCKINIIPFNEHPNSGYERPEESRIVAFHNELMRLGAHVLRRRTMGRDIYAACGQLTTVANKPTELSV